MLVVPIAGDKIVVDGWTDPVTVTSYSSLKKGGALYVKEPLDPKVPFVGFSQVLSINKVAVTMNGDNLFVSKGLIKRVINLPQIGDTITVLIDRDSQGVESHKDYEVTGVHLSHKTSGPIVVKAGKASFTLGDIQGLKRKLGSERFNERTFRSLYLDYMPIGT